MANIACLYYIEIPQLFTLLNEKLYTLCHVV